MPLLTTGAGIFDGAALPGPPTFVNTGFTNSASGSFPNYTASIPIGSAAANRRVFVLFIAVTGVTSTFSGTINGVPATFTFIDTQSASASETWLATAVVPSGTGNVDFNITASNTFFGFGAAVWTATDTDLISSVPFGISTTQNAGGDFATGLVNVPAQGSVIAFYNSFGQSGTDQDFTTPNSIGVVFEARFGIVGAAGVKNNASAETNGSVTGTATGSGNPLITLASFR